MTEIIKTTKDSLSFYKTKPSEYSKELHISEASKPTQKEIQKELIDSLTFLDTKYISRPEYNKLKGNIIVEYSKKEKQAFLNQTDKNGKHVSRKDYILYLPEDLKISEYASIIRKVNKLTFGEGKMPEYASVRELQVKIILVIKDIFEKKAKLTHQDREKEKQLNKALSKFIQTYEVLFPGESKKLSDSTYRNKIIYDEYKSYDRRFDFYDDLYRFKPKRELIHFRTQAELSKHIIPIIEQYKNPLKLINESKNKAEHNKTDYDKYHDSILTQHFYEAFFENGVNNLRFGLNIMTIGEQALLKPKEGDKISKIDTLQEKEKLLRDEINIEKYKQELQVLRQSGTRKQIAKKEKEASNAIIKSLHNNFPYQSTIEGYGEKPSKIQQSKELFCVGFSIVGHAFLSELRISHKGLDMPGHIALEVNILGKSYLFDATNVDEILEFSYGEKIGAYTQMNIKYRDYKYLENTFISGDVEKMFLSNVHYNLGIIYYDKKDYNKAIEIYKKAIGLNPKKSDAYHYLGIIYRNKQEYDKAIEMYKKAMELDPKDSSVYNNLGNTYNRKFNFKLANLYKYTSQSLKGKESLFNILYTDEKTQIDTFLKAKNYTGLRDYLFSIK